MVGTNPAGGGSTTVPVYLIPVKVTIGSVVYDPAVVLNSVLASPIFCTPPQGPNPCTIDFTSGGQDFGVTQYLDAYQRANFWIDDSGNNYHLLLGAPTVINESINPPTPADAGIFSDVCNVGGICEGWVQFQYWQNFVTQTMSSLLTSNQITQGGADRLSHL
jgi:hypothetical protein